MSDDRQIATPRPRFYFGSTFLGSNTTSWLPAMPWLNSDWRTSTPSYPRSCSLRVISAGDSCSSGFANPAFTRAFRMTAFGISSLPVAVTTNGLSRWALASI